jgi:L-ascorbate metabolism protein UlaG (beta-lactamase superfamily)
MSEDVNRVAVELIGGPTALIEIGGLRLLTDPTFNPPGPQKSGAGVLTKLTGPARSVEEIGPIDAVLLSHDQHGDNLDDAGRAMLPGARHVISTQLAASRLDAGVTPVAPWQRTTLTRPDGSELIVTAVPAVHGPDGT